jgi:hypothetical protein
MGKEEVRFFKKDLDEAPKICGNILKHAITGNQSLFANSVKDSGLAASELFMIRGL